MRNVPVARPTFPLWVPRYCSLPTASESSRLAYLRRLVFYETFGMAVGMKLFGLCFMALMLTACSGEDIDYRLESVYRGDVYALQVRKCEGLIFTSCKTRTVGLFDHQYDCKQESYWGAYQQPQMKRGRSGGTECVSTLQSKLPPGMVLSPNFR